MCQTVLIDMTGILLEPENVSKWKECRAFFNNKKNLQQLRSVCQHFPVWVK